MTFYLRNLITTTHNFVFYMIEELLREPKNGPAGEPENTGVAVRGEIRPVRGAYRTGQG